MAIPCCPSSVRVKNPSYAVLHPSRGDFVKFEAIAETFYLTAKV
jgi:hypothetical protein